MSRKNWRDRQATAASVRQRLSTEFPKCFSGKGEPKKPLKIGIAKDIQKATGLSWNDIKAGLGDYCHGASYHASVAKRLPRVDLAGVEGDLPNDSAVAHSLGVLRTMRLETQVKWYGSAVPAVDSGDAGCV